MKNFWHSYLYRRYKKEKKLYNTLTSLMRDSKDYYNVIRECKDPKELVQIPAYYFKIADSYVALKEAIKRQELVVRGLKDEIRVASNFKLFMLHKNTYGYYN